MIENNKITQQDSKFPKLNSFAIEQKYQLENIMAKKSFVISVLTAKQKNSWE